MHRKARKTTHAVNHLIKESVAVPAVYWYVLPTYNQAKDILWKDPEMLFKYIPDPIIEKKNEVELTIYLKNKAVIILKGADRPDLLRGGNPHGVVLDEFSVMKRELWDEVVQPIVMNRKGWTMFCFTPKGKNHAWELLQYAQSQEKQGSQLWLTSVLPASKSGILTEQALEEAKRSSPRKDIYNQEYEVEFLESGAELFGGFTKCVWGEFSENPKPGHVYVVGVDLARKKDFTSIKVFDMANNHLTYSTRFQRMDWPKQRTIIALICKKFNNALAVVDATGLGDVIVQDLSRMGISTEGFIFTEGSRKELLDKLSIFIQSRYVTFPYDDEIVSQLSSFQVDYTPSGRATYTVPDNMHDDEVMAMALGVHKLYPTKTSTEENQEEIEQSIIRRDMERQLQGDEALQWQEWSMG
jgi:hypothetical protein